MFHSIYHISIIRAVRTAVKLMLFAGNSPVEAFQTAFEMRFLFNQLYDAGYSPEELEYIFTKHL